MISFTVELLLIVAGVFVLVSAEKLDAFEKRLIDVYPKLKVTGWTGTGKGVMAWRGVGVLLVLDGSVFLIVDHLWGLFSR